MAWWNRWVGTPTIDVVAQDVLKRLRQGGLNTPRYDPQRMEIHVMVDDGPAMLYLGNLFQEYRSAQRAERSALVDRFLAGFFATEPEHDIPDRYEQARARILPIVRTRSAVSIADLTIALHAESQEMAQKSRMVTRPLLGEYVIALALDTPTALRNINENQLATWEVDFDQMLEDALQNLRGLPEHGGWHRSDGFLEATWGDAYESSRILLPDLIYRTGIVDPVVLMPLRNSLLVCSASDERALSAMSTRARQLMDEKPRWLSAQPLQLVDGKWKEFMPPDCCKMVFQDIAIRELAENYEGQKQLLEALHQRQGEDVFVASLSFLQKDNTIRSYAVWTQDVDTLLPHSDLIVFNRMEQDRVAESLVVTHTGAMPIVRDLVQDTDLSPLRLRVTGFPGPAQWKQLQQTAITSR